MLNQDEPLLVHEKNVSLECSQPKKQPLNLQKENNNSLWKNELSFFQGVLGERVNNMDDDEIKKEFLKTIDSVWLNDEFLLIKLREGIEEAVYQWPKWAMLTDRKAITQMIKLLFQLKWRLNSSATINILNAFWKSDIIL